MEKYNTEKISQNKNVQYIYDDFKSQSNFTHQMENLTGKEKLESKIAAQNEDHLQSARDKLEMDELSQEDDDLYPVPIMKKLQSNKVYRLKCLLTVAYTVAFLILLYDGVQFLLVEETAQSQRNREKITDLLQGWIGGQFGPTFLDLQIIANTSLQKSSAFFTLWRVGFLTGSMGTGLIFDRSSINHNMLMFASLLGEGIVVAIIPWCSQFELMLLTHAFKGLFTGAFDTCANADVIMMWGKQANAILQTVHFAYAAGGIISPIATAPYLTSLEHHLDKNQLDFNNQSSTYCSTCNTTIVEQNKDLLYLTHSKLNVSSTFSTESNSSAGYPEQIAHLTSRIYIPYTLSACLCVCVSIPFLVIILFSKRSKAKTKSNNKEENYLKTRGWKSRFFYILGIVNICIYMCMYLSVEKILLDFLATFTIEGLQWTKVSASYISSCVWASFAVGRFVGIFLGRLYSPPKILCIYNILLFVSSLGFLLMANVKLVAGIWIFAILGGFALSVIFPTVFAWTEQRFTRVTGKMSSAFLVSASAGGIVNPVILGHLMGNFTSLWFCYLLLGESIMLFCLFLFGVFISSKIHGKESVNNKLDFQIT